ncbi:ribose-phosphate diphosphokinase [Candidatus Dependentiae bacterium]|nr:ribose-phosphate diphosphokinase [Candidatus Dependentiae bacterium]
MFEIVADEKSILANFISSKYNKKIIKPRIKSFADSESFIYIKEFGELSKKNVLVFQQFNFQRQDNFEVDLINNQLFKFFLLCDFIKKLGALKIFAFLPYLPYSRQDKVFNGKMEGAVTLIGNFFKVAQVDKLIVVDLHEPEIKKDFVIDLEEITMINFWSNFLQKMLSDCLQHDDICLVAPDEGRCQLVMRIAEILGLGFAYVEKRRVGVDQAVAIDLIGDVKDKISIIIDDIIDTGKTAVSASQLLKKNGTKAILGCFTHCVMTQDSIEKIEKSNYTEIFVTDSVILNDRIKNSNKINIVSINNLLYEHVEKIWKNLK